jgi:branched-chain amino acid transport system permease protein
VVNSDIATVVPPTPTRRRFHIKRSMYWPLGLLAGAVVFFIYSYLDLYFRAQAIPPGVHDFMNTYLPLLNVNEAIVYVMAALGLNIVVGYAGLLDLGFVAFWAIGGYTAGWLASDFFYGQKIWFFGSAFSEGKPGVHLNVFIVLVAACVLCAIGGIIIGAPTLRLRSDYLALVTLGFGEIIGEVAFNGDNIFGTNITNGNRSISPVDYPRFLGFDSTGALTIKDLLPSDALPKFVLFCLFAAIIMFASLRIRVGRLGRAWLAIREDELAASLMGVPLMRTKLSAYALGAVAGGFAGVAYAIHVSGVFPDQLKFSISITLLAMVVLGGMGNVWGVTVGALILAWTNSTLLKEAQNAIEKSEGTGNTIAVILLIVAIALIVGGLLLMARGRQGLILIFLAVPLGAIGVILLTAKGSPSFQFLIFGSVLIIMMLFRREGLIPEARTRLVLREPGRTEAESLGADMEDVAPELESLEDDTVHAGGSVPVAEGADIDRDRT